ncbi:MAG: FAD-dependent oxidoreductase [Mycobacteriales bacterium]
MRAVVVGSGVSGLTCALRLSEAGCSVEVVSDQPPERTTSAIAAALWYPYRAFPEAEVTRWGAATYAVLAGLAGDMSTGVHMRTGRELYESPTADPWWRNAVPSLDRVPQEQLPPGYVDGIELTVPVIDPSVHLPWLVAKATGAGVAFRQAHVSDLAALAPDADVIVNCTGLGAQHLLGDDTLVPVRGQIVVVAQVGVTDWLLADTEGVEIYVIPREQTIVLGGTAQVGDTDLEPDAGTARAIRDRCIGLMPHLAQAEVLANRVGLRPARPEVRLESGRLSTGQPVVHNYGHGGAGWTLSYGCAADVVAMVMVGTG